MIRTLSHKKTVFFVLALITIKTSLYADQLLAQHEPNDTIAQIHNEFIPNFIKLSEKDNSHLQSNERQKKPVTQSQPVKEKTFEDYFNEGNTFLRGGNADEAIECYKKSVELNSSCAQVYFNMGVAYEKKGNLEEALTAFQRAILYKPSYTKAHIQLAKILEKKKLTDQALHHYEKALEEEPEQFDAQLAVGRILSEKEKFAQAAEYFRKALELRPNDRSAKFELANALNTINHTEQALQFYFELLPQNPNDTAITYNIAYTLKKLGRLQEAMPFYQATLEKNPDHSEAHFSLGLAYLLTGNFEKGWKEYEWRWKRQHQLTPRNFSQPEWDGSDLQGKTILLHAEQGLGDTLQFIRYAQIAKERNGTIIVAVQKSLVPLISLCPYIDQVVQLYSSYPSFDVQAPLMSLPYILKTGLDTIPLEIPYLYADPVLVEQWRNKLGTDKQFKIGICWQGNNKYSTPFLRAVVAAKSMKLTTLSPLSSVGGISIYSLQKENGIDQLKALPPEFVLHTFDGDFDESNGRFMDTAAVIKNLDLVISIDTSICHLAGSLGVPVWNLLPNPPDWRWMLDRPDTPWYPTMRLFRQPIPGDWQSVIAELVENLSALVAGKELPKTIVQENQKVKTAEPASFKQTSFDQTSFDQTSPKQITVSPEKHSPLLDQLNGEFSAVNSKMTKTMATIQKLQQEDPSNPSLHKQMRNFYILSELRSTLQEKINLLYEATADREAA